MAAVQPAGRVPCQDPPEGRETSPKREGTCRTVTGVRKALLTSLVGRTLSGLGGETIWVKPCAAQAAGANKLPGGWLSTSARYGNQDVVTEGAGARCLSVNRAAPQ